MPFPAANPTEREIRRRAIEHPCPTCGAAKNIRCRIKATGKVKQDPCPERSMVAWREMLTEGLTSP